MKSTTYSGDNDLGEMFLNYILHNSTGPYVGIDFTKCLLPPKENQYETRYDYRGQVKMWYRLYRCIMGSLSHPAILLTLECINGAAIGNVLLEKSLFFNNIRPTGKDFNHYKRVMHTTASKSNYLGQQDAPRKRYMPSQSPGLWSGSLVKTDNNNIFVSASQSKWNRGRSIIFWLVNEFKHQS